MKHEKGVRNSWFPRAEWEGLGKLQTKHEKGVGSGYFVVPKSGVGRAWEGSGVGYFVVPKSGVGRAWEGSK